MNKDSKVAKAVGGAFAGVILAIVFIGLIGVAFRLAEWAF